MHQSIYKRKWDEALDAIEKNPKETSTWMFHNKTDGTLDWKTLPIHACGLFNAPIEVYKAVLRQSPETVAMKCHNGNLPIHYAIKGGVSTDVVEELVTFYPESIHVLDEENNDPLMLATQSTSSNKKGYINVLTSGVKNISGAEE